MSGKKISEMTAITGAQLDQTNDVVPVLDVSDTSNPNKKISIQELASVIGASGTTNVSLALDGSNNLTLTDSDSNTVTVDLSALDNSSLTLADVTANGAVTSGVDIGIGTATPSDLLHVSGGAIRLDNLRQLRWGGDKTGFYGHNTQGLDFYSSGVTRFKIANDGKIGLNTTSPSVTLDIQGTDAVQLTSGTEAQRPTSPANGMIRYNSDDDVFEGYAGDSGIGDGAWVKTSGLTLADVTANGNFTLDSVGIGTSSPNSATRLHVVGGAKATDATTLLVENTEGDNLFVIKDGGVISSTSDNPYLVLKGDDVSFTNAAIQLISENASEQRGLGVFMYNAHSDFEWYSGTPYNSADTFMIGRKSSLTAPSSESSPRGITAQLANSYLTISNSGQLKLNTYTSTTHNGTPTSILGVDASGNVIKQDASGFLTSVPTLQEVTDVGNSTTNGISVGGNVGIGTTSASVKLVVNGTDAVQLTAGTEAQRPTSPANGMIRYNSDDDVFEGYAGDSGIGDGAWVKTSGLTLADVTANGAVTGENIEVTSLTDSYIRITSTGTGIGAGTVLGSLQFYGNDASVPGAGVKSSIVAQTEASLGDDSNLIFSTSNGTTNEIERLRISSTGNIGINQTTPTVTLDIQGTDAVQLTSGTEAQRPTSPANGMIRYNSDDDVFEGYAGDSGLGDGAWVKTSGLTLADVTANGNFTSNSIGVGSTSFTPLAKIHVKEDASNYILVERTTLGSEGNMFFGAATSSNEIISRGSGVSAKKLNFFIGNNNRLSLDTNSRIGVNQSSPSVTLDINGTDAVQLTAGTTAEQPGQTGQPTAAAGMIRFNTTTSKFEGYDGTSWIDLH